MEETKFGYVKAFELETEIPPCKWISVTFNNDLQLNNEKDDLLFLENSNNLNNYLKLMEAVCTRVENQFEDVLITYSHLNMVVFVIGENSSLSGANFSNLLSRFSSALSSQFVYEWSNYFDMVCKLAPAFLGRVHTFQTDHSLRLYLAMQQSVKSKLHLKYSLCSAIQGKEKPSLSEEKKNSRLLSDVISSPSPEHDLAVIKIENYQEEFSKLRVDDCIEQEIPAHGMTIFKVKTDISSENSSIVSHSKKFLDDYLWLQDLKMSPPSYGELNTNCSFEVKEKLLPHSWIVVRFNFTDFDVQSQEKECNESLKLKILDLINIAASNVLKQIPNVVMAFCETDHISFVVHRYSKWGEDFCSSFLICMLSSSFTAAYILRWKEEFQEVNTFNKSPQITGVVASCPTSASLRDYLGWRQKDCLLDRFVHRTAVEKLYNMEKFSKGLENVTRDGVNKSLFGLETYEKNLIIERYGVYIREVSPILKFGSILYRVYQRFNDIHSGFRRTGGNEDIGVDSASSESTQCRKKPWRKTQEDIKREYAEKYWWNADCVAAKMQRLHCRKKCHVHPTVQNLKELAESEAFAKKVFAEAKKNYKLKTEGAELCTSCGTKVPLNKETGSTETKEEEEIVVKSNLNNNPIVNAVNCELHLNAAAGIIGRQKNALPVNETTNKNPWWNENCRMVKIKRSEAKRTFVKDPSRETEQAYRATELYLKTLIKAAKKDYAERKVNIFSAESLKVPTNGDLESVNDAPQASGVAISSLLLGQSDTNGGWTKVKPSLIKSTTTQATINGSENIDLHNVKVLKAEETGVDTFAGDSGSHDLEIVTPDHAGKNIDQLFLSTMREELLKIPEFPSDNAADLSGRVNEINGSSQANFSRSLEYETCREDVTFMQGMLKVVSFDKSGSDSGYSGTMSSKDEQVNTAQREFLNINENIVTNADSGASSSTGKFVQSVPSGVETVSQNGHDGSNVLKKASDAGHFLASNVVEVINIESPFEKDAILKTIAHTGRTSVADETKDASVRRKVSWQTATEDPNTINNASSSRGRAVYGPPISEDADFNNNDNCLNLKEPNVERSARIMPDIKICHVDIVDEEFWIQNSFLLGKERMPIPQY